MQTDRGYKVKRQDGKPITPEQIANSSIEAARAGAAIVHVHVREPDTGAPSMRLELYREVVDRINAAVGEALPIDEFVVCAHDNGDHCPCRKPKPGMVLEAAARHAVDLGQSFLIGDRWRDVDCGRRPGGGSRPVEPGLGARHGGSRGFSPACEIGRANTAAPAWEGGRRLRVGPARSVPRS